MKIVKVIACTMVLASCSGENDPKRTNDSNISDEAITSSTSAEPSPPTLQLLGKDENGKFYLAPVPSGIDASSLKDGQMLDYADEQVATKSVLGAGTEKGCCRVRVKWRVKVTPPVVVVGGGGVTVKPPEVTVGSPTVSTSGWPEIRWDAQSVVPKEDPPQFYDVSQQCVDDGPGSTVFVTNNEDKKILIRLLVQGFEGESVFNARERRAVFVSPHLNCSVTQSYVTVYGNRKS
tara:strand:+ start:552 stop:1253 length:702 start_codon:yes stop_codon:yes gene_type:complete